VSIIYIFLAGVVGLIVGTAAGRKLLINENRGEALVANTLQRLTRMNVLLNNVTLTTESGTTQIDHILVTEAGLFVIETKHYTGWILGQPHDDYWTQVIYRKKSRFRNPLMQNYGHLKTVQSLFKLPESAFIGVVVFTGDAEIKTNVGPNVIQLNQLLDFIEHRREPVLDERQMAYVVGRLEMKRLRRSLETDEYHLNYVRKKVAGNSVGAGGSGF
jgi:hypothetical protein